jgi:uncharacterized protein YggU (UPF0235/DUF167 family)
MPAAVPESRRIAVRVRPGASRTLVGGRYGEGPQARLVVAVSARAVDGAATEAVLAAVADAVGVRRHQVQLVRGKTSRDKLVQITNPPDDLDIRLGQLLGPSPGS